MVFWVKDTRFNIRFSYKADVLVTSMVCFEPGTNDWTDSEISVSWCFSESTPSACSLTMELNVCPASPEISAVSRSCKLKSSLQQIPLVVETQLPDCLLVFLWGCCYTFQRKRIHRITHSTRWQCMCMFGHNYPVTIDALKMTANCMQKSICNGNASVCHGMFWKEVWG